MELEKAKAIADLTDPRRTIDAAYKYGLIHSVCLVRVHYDGSEHLWTNCLMGVDPKTELLLLRRRPEDITCPMCKKDVEVSDGA